MDPAVVLNLPLDFKFKGASYKLARRNFETMTLFSQWVKQHVIDEIERLREQLPVHAYRMMYAEFLTNLAAGAYQFGMPLCNAAGIAPEGAKHLAYLDLLALNPGISPATVEELYDSPADWESFCQLRGVVNADPTTGATPSPADAP